MDEWQQRVHDFGELTNALAEKVPKALAGELTLDQATRLHQALEQHVQNAEALVAALEEAEQNDHLIEAAEALDDMTTQLAQIASATANEMMEMHRERLLSR